MADQKTKGLEDIPKYFISAPQKKHVLFTMLVAAVLFPVVGNDIFSKAGYAIFLVVPAVLSSALTWRVVRNFGGYCKEKHALLMSTISMFAVAIAIAAVLYNGAKAAASSG